MFAVEIYAAVRRFVFVEGKSRREAARVFGLCRDTIAKMCRYSAPPGYVRSKAPERPKLGPLVPVIDAILESDKTAPPKQRHTAKRIFERLRIEHGFAGGYTAVKDYVRLARTRSREVFVPLAHPPGHAQVDFGECIGVIGGVRMKLHVFCFDLPHSDACFIKAYPAETTEAFLDGHISAFAFFGGVPLSILYDNLKIAVARILGDRERRLACLYGGRRCFLGVDGAQRVGFLLPRLHGACQPLPISRAVWPPGEGKRQRQGRSLGKVFSGEFPHACAACSLLRRAQRRRDCHYCG